MSVYEERNSHTKSRIFGLANSAHLFRIQERHRETLRILEAGGHHPLSDLRILDVGCGDGNMLRQFLQWGAEPGNLAGIELRSHIVDYARHLNPNIDILRGSAAALPWPAGSYDLVCQHTVFTSILDPAMRQQIAAEMTRVLSRGGAVLWYDFMHNNPRNLNVSKVSATEIRTLFPDLEVRLRRISLAPPIARRIPVRYLALLYPLLSSIPLLRSHYLGLLTKS